MSLSLTPEEESQYTAIIDAILASANLETITRKKIRAGLEIGLGGKELSTSKSAIKALIDARFDAISTKTIGPDKVLPQDVSGPGYVSPPCTPVDKETDGITPTDKDSNRITPANDKEDESGGVTSDVSCPISSSPAVITSDVSTESLIEPAKKKQRRETSMEEDDAKLAAELQAQENNLARSRTTRGRSHISASPNKKKTPASRQKKSDKRVRAEDDSDLGTADDDSSPTKRKRSGGFQKPFNLSPALADVCGSSQLSRTQVVKQLWQYIKLHDRQDPSNKKHILCDDKLHAVFGNNMVDMFGMNKVLSSHLWPIEE